MARNSFGRTVVKTICEVKYVDEKNGVQKGTVIVYGNYDIDSAQNAVRKALNNNRAIVYAVKHESFYGTISMEKFAENCDTITNRKEW